MTRPLRIGILSMPWPVPPPAYGGLELAVDGLCRGLAARGAEVFLWSHPDSNCPVHRGATSARVRSGDGWHSVPVELSHILAGYRWLASRPVDLVHDFTLTGPLAGPSLISVPVIASCLLPFQPPAPGQTYADVSLLYQTLGERVPVLAVSHGHASRALGPVAGVIHLGTEVAAVSPGPGTGDERGDYVLFLGRMAPEKGVLAAVRACLSAGARLKIAARMEEAQEVAYYREHIAPFTESGAVEYVGEATTAGKTELLRGASALVNPITWEEPFGLVMIEALAAGTPVIARRGGSVAEIVEPGVTGAVCDSQQEVVDAIRQRAGFSRAACRERAERLFSYAVMTDSHLAFYEQVLSGGLRPCRPGEVLAR